MSAVRTKMDDLKRDAITLGSWLVACGVVVLVFIALLWFLRWRNWGSDAVIEKTRGRIAEQDVRAYLSALALYKINQGQYPSEADGLQALLGVGVTKIADDPWGRPFLYVVDPKLPDGVGVYSMGPDGKTETRGNDPDDVNSWREEVPR